MKELKLEIGLRWFSGWESLLWFESWMCLFPVLLQHWSTFTLTLFDQTVVHLQYIHATSSQTQSDSLYSFSIIIIVLLCRLNGICIHLHQRSMFYTSNLLFLSNAVQAFLLSNDIVNWFCWVQALIFCWTMKKSLHSCELCFTAPVFFRPHNWIRLLTSSVSHNVLLPLMLHVCCGNQQCRHQLKHTLRFLYFQ